MKQYKEFKSIKAEYKKQALARLQSNIKYYNELSAEAFADRAVQKLNKRDCKKTITEQRKLFYKKLRQEAEADVAKFNNKCDQIAAATPCKFIYIDVTWNNNRTWGKNPHAEVRSGCNYNEGRASGCGYDKLSSAIASAVNADYSILTRLYNYYEAQLRKNKEGRSPHNLIAYGSGYLYPYFEGGVGYSCHQSIFKILGAKTNTWRSGQNWDSMIIEF